MEKLKTLIISRKVNTPIEFDFTGFKFPEGSKVIWTVKLNEDSPELFTREFNAPQKYQESITVQEGNKLTEEKYCYDFVLELADGTKLKQCLISDIIVEGVIYGTRN